MPRVYTKGYAKKYGEKRYYYPEAMRRYNAKTGRNKKKSAEGRAFINQLKDRPCMDCGGRFPPECMDFDHVRGVKNFGVSSRATSPKSLILTEIAKCDLICSNCHRIRTKARKQHRPENGAVYVGPVQEKLL